MWSWETRSGGRKAGAFSITRYTRLQASLDALTTLEAQGLIRAKKTNQPRPIPGAAVQYSPRNKTGRLYMRGNQSTGDPAWRLCRRLTPTGIGKTLAKVCRRSHSNFLSHGTPSARKKLRCSGSSRTATSASSSGTWDKKEEGKSRQKKRKEEENA